VAVDDVLHDREAQARAAHGAAAMGVDAVEPFRQARHVLRIDPVAPVGHIDADHLALEAAAAILARELQVDLDGPARRISARSP
jgi:hypothetical protein